MSTETIDNPVLNKQSVKVELEPPKLWHVILLNDNVTTHLFVIGVLVQIMHKTVSEAIVIADEVHLTGRGSTGLFPKDIAETKASLIVEAARANKFPLQSIIEID